MFRSLLKVVLSPVDITVSAAKDVVSVVTMDLDKEVGEETGESLDRLKDNLAKTFKPD